MIANIISAICLIIMAIMAIINGFKSNDIIVLSVLLCAFAVNTMTYFTTYSSKKMNNNNNSK